jgi:UDP-N-acetylmuramyl-tripeptide synthetase
MKISFSDLLSGYELLETKGDGQKAMIQNIATHSQEVIPGSLFVSIKGFKEDGDKYIPEALKRGAVAVLSETREALAQVPCGGRVRDTRAALSWIANKFYQDSSSKLKVVGVTGTNGKTTTCFMIAEILQAAGFKTGVFSTVSYQIGHWREKPQTTTPDALQLQKYLYKMAQERFQYAVLEVSSHALALSRVDDIKFRSAVFTNLTEDHLDFHVSFENYFKAKKRLLYLLEKNSIAPTAKTAIINGDDQYFSRLIPEVKCKLLTYGLKESDQLRATEIKKSSQGLSFKACLDKLTLPVELSLPGEFNLYNALAAIAFSLSEGIAPEVISGALQKFRGVKGRFERITTEHHFQVIIDYAHTPDALARVLQATREITPKRIILVFGCGGNRERAKRPLMGQIAAQKSDYTIITTDNPRDEDPVKIALDIEIGFKKAAPPKANYQKILDRETAIKEALTLAREGDSVVIAGKGHEEYQIFGTQVFPFSDHKVVKEILNKKR